MMKRVLLVMSLVVLAGMVPMASATTVQLASFNHSVTASEVLDYNEGLSAGSDATGLSVVDIVNGGTYSVTDGVTLTLTGLGDDGATSTFTCGSETLYFQNLASGTFKIERNSDNAILLEGDITAAQLLGTVGQSATSVWTLDSNVSYTGGLILSDSSYGIGDTGSFSWSLTILSAAGPEVTGSQLQPFTAYADGHFNVPEPATVSLLVTGTACLLARRRRRRKV